MIFEKQIEKLYRGNLFVRQDNADGIFYFAPEDFPGLQAHPYSFPSKAGHALQGFFYHYADPIPGRLVVFDHGMGNGHRAYLREIQRLAKAGFLVFSYDHTGCMASGGESTNGFAQSLRDLDECITALKAEPRLSGRSIAVMGHSWGGFSTMNISALHPGITHVVSLSGFIRVEQILNQMFSGILSGFRAGLYELERQANPEYIAFDAVQSLKHTDAKVLLIYSADDPVVSKAHHFDVLSEALKDRENIRFLLVDGKGHNPNYTADAVKYKDDFFARLQKLKKKKLLRTPEQQRQFMSGFDWFRMTEQDEAVWAEILNTLKTE